MGPDSNQPWPGMGLNAKSLLAFSPSSACFEFEKLPKAGGQMGRQMMGNMMQDMAVSQLCVLPVVHGPILTRFTWTGCVEGPGVQAAPNPEPGEAPSPRQPTNTAGFAFRCEQL